MSKSTNPAKAALRTCHVALSQQSTSDFASTRKNDGAEEALGHLGQRSNLPSLLTPISSSLSLKSAQQNKVRLASKAGVLAATVLVIPLGQDTLHRSVLQVRVAAVGQRAKLGETEAAIATRVTNSRFRHNSWFLRKRKLELSVPVFFSVKTQNRRRKARNSACRVLQRARVALLIQTTIETYRWTDTTLDVASAYRCRRLSGTGKALHPRALYLGAWKQARHTGSLQMFICFRAVPRRPRPSRPRPM